MALLHKATLSPGKLDALAPWLPEQPWGSPAIEQVGAYRFDDPAGEVGLEVLLLRTEGGVLQVPLTYRAEPLAGAGLISTTEHSVLGTRWIYDGCTDPVWLRTLVATILTGGHEAALEFPGGETREPSVRVRGTGSGPVPTLAPAGRTDSGTATVVDAGPLAVTVHRRLSDVDTSDPALLGTWAGQSDPVVLATVR